MLTKMFQLAITGSFVAYLPCLAWAADWQKIYQSSSAIIYVDKSSIQTKGAAFRIRALQDYSVPIQLTTATISSTKEIIEFDCSKQEYLFRERTAYEKNMGTGKIVGETKVTSPAKWNVIVDGSPADRISRLGCKNKNERSAESNRSPETDQCLSWGLKHGTSEYADCQIKLLSIKNTHSDRQDKSNRSSVSAPTPPAAPSPPVRNESSQKRDLEECALWAGSQHNPYTAQVKELSNRLYGQPRTFTYSGTNGFGTISEMPDLSTPSGGLAGVELGELRAKEESFPKLLILRCMKKKGYVRN